MLYLQQLTIVPAHLFSHWSVELQDLIFCCFSTPSPFRYLYPLFRFFSFTFMTFKQCKVTEWVAFLIIPAIDMQKSILLLTRTAPPQHRI